MRLDKTSEAIHAKVTNENKEIMWKCRYTVKSRPEVLKLFETRPTLIQNQQTLNVEQFIGN